MAVYSFILLPSPLPPSLVTTGYVRIMTTYHTSTPVTLGGEGECCYDDLPTPLTDLQHVLYNLHQKTGLEYF